MFNILKEYSPLRYSYNNDHFAMWLNVIGGLFVAVTFIYIGLYAILSTPKTPASRNRMIARKLLGWFILSCGFSRAIDVLAMWDNLAILTGYIKIVTGTISFLVISQIPTLNREEHTVMNGVKEELRKTQETLSEIKKISNDLDKK